MRYYVVAITNGTGGENRICYGFDTLDQAQTYFHRRYAECIESASIDGVLIILVNAVGGEYDKKTWGDVAPKPELETAANAQQ